MGNHLKVVQDFCENSFNKGKIIPLSFQFPSFQITEDMFRNTALEVIEDKVRLGIDAGTYKVEALDIVKEQVSKGLKSQEYGKKFSELINGLDYDGLIDAQKAVQNGNANQKQQNYMIFTEKMLQRQMDKDENLDRVEIGRKTLNEVCVSRLKDSVANIEVLGAFTMPDGMSGRVSHTNNVEKDQFAATMIMMKEMIPTAYRQINLSLKNYPNQNIVEDLKELEKNPSIMVVEQIRKIDSKFSEKHFPKEHMFLEKNSKVKLDQFKF